MTMLYKLTAGFVKEEHYGLTLARVINLPPKVLEVAEKVSLVLEAQAAAKKRSSRASAIANRRKLVLALYETLNQARDGPMEGKVLLSWLSKVQEEFVRRMEKIERDADGFGEGEDKDIVVDISSDITNERTEPDLDQIESNIEF
jgi:DNA mismatch repair protein MSH4